MTCTCPKCHATVELDLPEVTEEGSSVSCPSCKASFNVHRESFGGRVFRRTGEISCADCGQELGPELHCRNCGKPYPDYLVAGLGRKRGARKISVHLKTSPIPKRKHAATATSAATAATSTLPTLEAAMREEAAPKVKKVAAKSSTSKMGLVISVVAVVVLALAAGGAFFLKKRAETEYMRNYALAAYGVQLTADKGRAACQKLATDWKARLDAGQTFIPRIGPDDEKELSGISGKLGAVKGKLNKEPAKFKDCTGKLDQLQRSSDKLRVLALSPPGSLPALNDSIGKLDTEYKQAVTTFKGEIPPDLLDYLKLASDRYRGLKPMFK